MTQDEIISMAKEAGFIVSEIYGPMVDVYAVGHDLERFAALVEAKEREACAQVAAQTVCDTHIPTGINIYGTRAAKAIRARGNT